MLWRSRSLWISDMMKMMKMMKGLVLVVLLSCCLCGAEMDPGIEGTEDQGLGGVPVFQTLMVLKDKMAQLEREVTELRGPLNSPRVAFSVALFDTEEGNYGPFNVATPIKYKKVLTNLGNNYNPATGIFTATVKGMYVFIFSMFNNMQSPSSAAVLKKNQEGLAYALDRSTTDTHDSSTRAAVVALEVGDNVYVELEQNMKIYDHKGDHNSFSGFLLFTM